MINDTKAADKVEIPGGDSSLQSTVFMASMTNEEVSQGEPEVQAVSDSADISASGAGGRPGSSPLLDADVARNVGGSGVDLTQPDSQAIDARGSVENELSKLAAPELLVATPADLQSDATLPEGFSDRADLLQNPSISENIDLGAGEGASNAGSSTQTEAREGVEIQAALMLEGMASQVSTDTTGTSNAIQHIAETATADTTVPPTDTALAAILDRLGRLEKENDELKKKGDTPADDTGLKARLERLEQENEELKKKGHDARNDTPSKEMLESLLDSQKTALESVLSQTIAHTQAMIDAVSKQTADNAAKHVDAAREIAESLKKSQADREERAEEADRQRREADAARVALREREEEQRATQKSEPAEKNSKADSEERARQVNAQVDREVQRDFPFVFKTPGTGGSAHLPGAFTKDDLQKWREVPVRETDKSFYAKEQHLSQEWDLLKKNASLSKEEKRARTKTLKLESQSLKEEKEQAIRKWFGPRIVIGHETPSWFSKARRFVTEIGGMVSSWGVIAGTAWGATQLVTAGSGIGVSVAAAAAGLVTGTIVTRYVSGMLSGFWGDRVANFGGLFVNVGVLGSAYWLTQVWGMQAGLNAGEKGIVCAVVGGLGWLLGKGLHKLGENTYQNTVKTLYEAAMEAGSWPARLAYTQELYEAIERKQQGKVLFPDSHATFSSATLKGIWNRWLLGRIPQFSWDLSKDENSVDHVKLKLLLATRIAAEKYKKELITGVENDPNAVNSYKTQFKAIEEAMKNIEVRSSLLREINWSGTKLLAFPLGASAIAGVFGGVPLADTLFGLVRPFLP